MVVSFNNKCSTWFRYHLMVVSFNNKCSTWFQYHLMVCRLTITRRLLLMEQELFTRSKHLSSSPVLVVFVLLFTFVIVSGIIPVFMQFNPRWKLFDYFQSIDIWVMFQQ
jgi:hypothetical protein